MTFYKFSEKTRKFSNELFSNWRTLKIYKMDYFEVEVDKNSRYWSSEAQNLTPGQLETFYLT